MLFIISNNKIINIVPIIAIIFLNTFSIPLYIINPIIPPKVLLIISVISEAPTPKINCNTSHIKLIKKKKKSFFQLTYLLYYYLSYCSSNIFQIHVYQYHHINNASSHLNIIVQYSISLYIIYGYSSSNCIIKINLIFYLLISS